MLGRFISRDPLSNAEFSQGTNLYAYCENDYLNRLDPSGNSFLGVVTGILDVAGCIPVVQDFTDPVSAVVSLTQGDYAGAGLALAGMIPGAGEAADIAKAAKDVNHLVKDGEGAAKETEDAIKCAEGACFVVGTLISTPGGEKPIEQITPGDEVYAYDFGQNKVVASHVLAVYRNTTTEWDDLTFQDGETVHSTPNHPYWIDSMHSWVGASQLKPGMEVKLENGQEEAVLSNVLRRLSKPETTYNFQVENEHDYFVGLGQILVHNACQAKGAYVHDFESGMQYAGKGTEKRAGVSGKQVAAANEDKLVGTKFSPSTPNTNAQAFKDEAQNIRDLGGVKGGKLYNKINSPGEKMLPPPKS